jgi:hypothetical protein
MAHVIPFTPRSSSLSGLLRAARQAAGLRHARDEAIEAYKILVETDDRLLAADPVEQLIVYVGFGDPSVVRPAIERMLDSEYDNVREAGGRLAAFGALELGLEELLTKATAGDAAARKGAAHVCANRLPFAGDATVAANALKMFFDDDEPSVRDAAADVAAALRDRDLRRHDQILQALIGSEAFPDALVQLLITLDQATERVDELVLLTARRFLDVYSGELDTFATAASGHAKEMGELVLRAYAQSSDAQSRSRALDLIDELLAQAAYRFSDLVADAER